MRQSIKNALIITHLLLSSSVSAGSIRGSRRNDRAVDKVGDLNEGATAAPIETETENFTTTDTEDEPRRRTRQVTEASLDNKNAEAPANNADEEHLLNSPSSSDYDQLHRAEKAILFPSKRIIGGSAAAISDYPHIVSIQDKNGVHFCGGTVVSIDTILTAAHCSAKVTGNSLQDMRVVIGRSDLTDESSGEVIQVRSEKVHSGYSRFDNDFALLFLKRPTMLGKVIQLNSKSSSPDADSRVTVLGWGDTDADESVRLMSNKLREANLRVLSNDECDMSTGRVGSYQVSYSGFITDNMICAWHKQNDSCQGDSGGPLIVKDSNGKHRQVGVVSWGVGCASDFPGVYARVSSAHGWIKRHVCSKSAYPDLSFDCEPF